MEVIGFLQHNNALDFAGQVMMSSRFTRYFKVLPHLDEEAHEGNEIEYLTSKLKEGWNIEVGEDVLSQNTYSILRDGLQPEWGESHAINIYKGGIGEDVAYFVYGSYLDREFYLNAILDRIDYYIFSKSIEVIEKQLHIDLSKGLMSLLEEMNLNLKYIIRRLKTEAELRIMSIKGDKSRLYSYEGFSPTGYPCGLMPKYITTLDDEGCYVGEFYIDIYLIPKLFALDILHEHKLQADSLEEWVFKAGRGIVSKAYSYVMP